MAKPLKMLEEAVIEAQQAFQWYSDRSERAGHRFQKAFEKAIADVLEHPDRWPEYLQGTRYTTLKRFPYLIVYRELDEEVQIIAVAHAHRRQGYWKRRLS